MLLRKELPGLVEPMGPGLLTVALYDLHVLYMLPRHLRSCLTGGVFASLGLIPPTGRSAEYVVPTSASVTVKPGVVQDCCCWHLCLRIGLPLYTGKYLEGHGVASVMHDLIAPACVATDVGYFIGQLDATAVADRHSRSRLPCMAGMVKGAFVQAQLPFAAAVL